MKHAVVMAVAGSMIIHTFGAYKQDKKHDLFLKADLKYHERKSCPCAKNAKVKTWKVCRVV